MSKRLYVDVEVDLGDFETEDLLDELKSRGRHVPSLEVGGAGDWLDRLRWFLLHRDTESALAMVEAELWPARNAAAVETARMRMTH